MKKVLAVDEFNYNTAKVGDLVTEEVVDNAMNALPPACMSARCSQLGEPYSHRVDHMGRWRATFPTFSKVCHGVWEFRGYCFRGEVNEPFDSPLSAVIE